jgi:predicted DNA-binding transcriptional regulator YafY
MATNKHALIRYRTIDRCLRNKHVSWNWKNLAEECAHAIYQNTGREVTLSERTIKGDISAMRSNEVLGYFAPIEYDRKEKSYYYADAHYRLFESPISPSDKEDLTQALAVLRQFAGFRDMMGIQDIITKLQVSVDRRSQSNFPVIQFDHPLDAPGQEWLYILYMSIVRRQCIHVGYQAFRKSRAAYILSPFLLKEYKSRWYLIAFSHSHSSLRTFALDRIKDIRESFAEYVSDRSFDPNRYFDDIVGITLESDKKPEEIKFEAFGTQVEYFKTKPLHKSQVLIKEREESAIFRIRAMVNFELLSEIFSYRENMHVLSPDHVREEIVTSLSRMNKIYSY